MKVRERVLEVIATFQEVMMLTFTVDGKLFGNNPRKAFEYVRTKRSIAKVIERLHKAGHLLSKRFFCAIEWQKNEMPHWHVLVEAKRVPIVELYKAWGRFRPRDVEKWSYSYQGGLEGLKEQGAPPEFGSVNFRKYDFETRVHAANYAMAYVTKYPEHQFFQDQAGKWHGFPKWVFDLCDEGKQIKRYTTSHGFFGRKAKDEEPGQEVEEEPEPSPVHARDCFCEKCQEGSAIQEKPRRRRRALSERLAACGEEAILCDVPLYETPEGIAFGPPKFRAALSMTFENAKRLCEVEQPGSFFVSWAESEFLVKTWPLWEAQGMVPRAKKHLVDAAEC